MRLSRSPLAPSSSSVRHKLQTQIQDPTARGRQIADGNFVLVSGGFATVQPNSVLSINAVEGYPLEDFSAEAIRAQIAEAQKVANGSGSEQDIAEAKIELEVGFRRRRHALAIEFTDERTGSRDPVCAREISVQRVCCDGGPCTSIFYPYLARKAVTIDTSSGCAPPKLHEPLFLCSVTPSLSTLCLSVTFIGNECNKEPLVSS